MGIRCFMLEPTGSRRVTYDCNLTVDLAEDVEPPACPCGGGHDWNVSSPLYRRGDTGEVVTFNDAPVGAVLDWGRLHTERAGPDGRYLVCKVPDSRGGHGWHMDGRASNCTMPEDNEHRCWVRHGEPPDLTVDKNGHTCAAGGGSIQTDSWHGFLRGGELVE